MWCQSRAEAGGRGRAALCWQRPRAAVPHRLSLVYSCSYLWIVPISSLRNGAQQSGYWLQGQARGNPALPGDSRPHPLFPVQGHGVGAMAGLREGFLYNVIQQMEPTSLVLSSVLLPSCVTLGKLPSLSGLHFLIYKMWLRTVSIL